MRCSVVLKSGVLIENVGMEPNQIKPSSINKRAVSTLIVYDPFKESHVIKITLPDDGLLSIYAVGFVEATDGKVETGRDLYFGYESAKEGPLHIELKHGSKELTYV
jgi:hypothetical protein